MTVGILAFVLLSVVINIILLILFKKGKTVKDNFLPFLIVVVDCVSAMWLIVIFIISHWNTPISF